MIGFLFMNIAFKMNIVWILFGIITLSGTLPFCEAQISQLSSNQNDLYGGTYIENAWSADSLASAANKPVPTWQRVQQHVLNPNMLGSFQQNLPSNDIIGQRSKSLSPTVFPETRTTSQGMGPFDSNIRVEATMYKTEPVAPTTAVYDRLLVGVTRDRQNRVTARYKLDKEPGLVEPRPTVSRFQKNPPSRYRILPDGSIVDYGISFSGINPRNIPSTRDVRPTVAQPAPPSSTHVTRIDTMTVKSGRFSTKPMTTSRSRPSAAPKISQTVKPAVKSVDSIQPSKIWTRPTGSSAVALPFIQRRPQTSPVSRARKRPADDGVSRNGGVVVDDPRWQFEPKSDTRTRYYTPSRTQSIRMTPTTTTTTTTTTTPAPTTIKTTTTTKQTPWNGPGAVNITYGDDNHVCPPSRARWQDYTVFLETKPRLCMIQITWNARYEREPIYHNSWWGVDVEWVYKPVYDPKVEFVDMHGKV